MSNEPNIQTNGWAEWSRHVLAELARLDKSISDLEKQGTETQLKVTSEIAGLKDVFRTQMNENCQTYSNAIASLKSDIAVMKVQNGIWGSLSGGITGIVTTIILWLSNVLKN